jgi:hypothetical protein
MPERGDRKGNFQYRTERQVRLVPRDPPPSGAGCPHLSSPPIEWANWGGMLQGISVVSASLP